jgi:hypothetical protein
MIFIKSDAYREHKSCRNFIDSNNYKITVCFCDKTTLRSTYNEDKKMKLSLNHNKTFYIKSITSLRSIKHLKTMYHFKTFGIIYANIVDKFSVALFVSDVKNYLQTSEKS